MAIKSVSPSIRHGFDRKLYAVVVELPQADGCVVARPIGLDLKLGAFPDGGTRFQAKKLLPRVKRIYPDAKIRFHQDICRPTSATQSKGV